MKKIAMVVVTLITGFSMAANKVSFTEKKPKILDIYDVKKLPAAASASTKLKWAEIKGEWKSCRQQGTAVLNQKLPFQGWILHTFIKCARKEIEETKSKATLEKVLDQSHKVRVALVEGPWKGPFRAEYNRLLISAQRVGKLSDTEVDKFFRDEQDLSDDNVRFIWASIYPASKKVKKDAPVTGLGSGNAPKKADDRFLSLSDTARVQHRKMAYEESLKSAQNALKIHPQDIVMLWIAGRSALFLGQYEEAKKHFTNAVEIEADGPESEESNFRLGLIHYRLGNYQLAIQPLEALIEKKSDRYELSSWYWVYRSLQGMKSDKADAIRQHIVYKYPYSYYGLKLLNNFEELPQDKFVFEEKSLPMFGVFADSHTRINALLKNGWIIEAQMEANDWPLISSVEWAHWLAERRLWPAAIRAINRAVDDEQAPKTWEIMSEYFPLDYSDEIKEVAAKYKVDPVLVQSLIRQESAYGLKAYSTSQAAGLMQMIPTTAAELARNLKLKIDLEEEIFLPQYNLPMGTSYLAEIIDDYGGHVPLALASYNAGPHKIKTWLGLRPETANLKEKKSTELADELWMDELPFYETSSYVKAILRNVILYRLKLDPKYQLQPNFWLDLWQKKPST
ncbi:MAG: transglycosylase SLT domain-containing protein [Bdellovibrionota bacterium]